MIFRLFFSFVFLVIWVHTDVFSQQDQDKQWSLQDCIEQAWQNNLQLQQQKLSVDIARENLTQSQANLFPTLNANASHSYNFGRTVDPFTNEFATERVRSNNFNLSSSLNLFSGFQVQNTIRQNRMELDASRMDLEYSYNDIALLVASAYLQILFNLELVENTSGQVEITRLQVERTRQLVEAGTLPRGALLTIKAQLASEELQLVNAQNQLNLSYLNLQQILFLPGDEVFQIQVPEIAIEPDEELTYTPLQVYRVAVQEQPQVKSAEIRIQSAERGVAIAQGGRSPMLSVRGSYGTGYSGASLEATEMIMGEPREIGVTASGEKVFAPSFEYETRVIPFSDQLNDNLNRSIGFALTIPIFNNFQTRSAISRSKINLENARLQNQIVREQLFQTIQQAHADASAALKRYAATEINVKALEESFRYTEQRFTVGMVNSLEYNDAKNRLSAAQSELLQSKYEYIFRLKVLEFYQGVPLQL